MEYTLSNNTYFAKPKDDTKDRIEVEIGDSKQPDIKPQLKIMRWDNEVNVSIRLKDFDNYSVIESNNKIIFSNNKQDVYFYNLTDGEGGYEIEVILKEKPKSNVIEFTLVDKDVDYFYQPKIENNQIEQEFVRTEEKERLYCSIKRHFNFQPDNVIGSYAVYAKIQRINYVGGKEYKNGKIGHIYRPKIVDSNGLEAWGELHIENGILSVTIPQEFLDKAVYPVKHAAGLTFGYTTLGEILDFLYQQDCYGPGYEDNRIGCAFDTTEAGSVSKLTFGWYEGDSPIDVKIFINDKDSVASGQHGQIGSGSGTINVPVNNWTDVSLTCDVTYPNTYILSICASASGMCGSYLKYDNVGGFPYYKEASSTYASPESPWVVGVSTGRKYSFYATYTVAAPPPTGNFFSFFRP